jgi:hypothetical protein
MFDQQIDTGQRRSASMTAWAKACRASCGILWPAGDLAGVRQTMRHQFAELDPLIEFARQQQAFAENESDTLSLLLWWIGRGLRRRRR